MTNDFPFFLLAKENQLLLAQSGFVKFKSNFGKTPLLTQSKPQLQQVKKLVGLTSKR